jgi:hypothetical protein
MELTSTEISYFTSTSSTNIMILWTENLDVVVGNGIKTVFDLQSYWTSMAAILASLFSQAEWLKFLLQLYRELTAEP